MKSLFIATMLFTALGASSQDFLKRIKNKVAANAEAKAGDRISETVTAPLDKKSSSGSSSTAAAPANDSKVRSIKRSRA